MKLKEILESCGHLEIHEKRVENDDYCEIVFFSRDIGQWARILSDLLGPARKSAGAAPSEADLALTRRTGGIRTDQTLFEKEFESGTVIAKFWPWQDGLHVTLKMAVLLK